MSAEYANPREVRVKYVRAEARRRAHRAAPHAAAALRSGRKRLTALPGNFAALTRPGDLLICTHSSFLEILFLDARWAAPLAFPLPPRLTGPFALPPLTWSQVQPRVYCCGGRRATPTPRPAPPPPSPRRPLFTPQGTVAAVSVLTALVRAATWATDTPAGAEVGGSFPSFPPCRPSCIPRTHARHTHTHTLPRPLLSAQSLLELVRSGVGAEGPIAMFPEVRRACTLPLVPRPRLIPCAPRRAGGAHQREGGVTICPATPRGGSAAHPAGPPPCVLVRAAIPSHTPPRTTPAPSRNPADAASRG